MPWSHDIARTFGGEDEPTSFALEPGADDLLGPPGGRGAATHRIRVGGVEEIDPVLGGGIQHRVGARPWQSAVPAVTVA